MSGERGRLLGNFFEEDTFWLILDLIGYSERTRSDPTFGIDLVADPPEEISGHIRPRYSPNGRTAFEFKQGGISRNDITDLASKIGHINANGPEGIRNIVGGVIISGFKVDNRDLYRLAEQKQINIWDVKRLYFYATKYCFFKLLKQSKPVERTLSSNTSFFQYFDPSHEGVTLRLAVFVDDPFHFMDQNTTEELLMELNNSLFSQLQSQRLPMELNLQFHALGGFTVTVDSLATTLRQYTTADLNFTLGGLYSYITAPWRPMVQLILGR